MSGKTTTSSGFPPAVIAAAQEAQRLTGCLASVSLAQWALESGWGKYLAGPHNYFGMKWYRGCKYPFAVKHTKEVYKGKWITVEAKFQAFPDDATAFTEHGKLLMRPTGPYRKALPYRMDWREWIMRIAPIYATDPHYADKLISIIITNSLLRHDM
jgi:flagellum-specific peptidoglycan hydrolase FlgJ